MELTKRQLLVYKIIKEYQAKNFTWPTIKDIREKMGVKSDFGVMRHLDHLVEKGYLELPTNPSGNRKIRMMKLLK